MNEPSTNLWWAQAEEENGPHRKFVQPFHWKSSKQKQINFAIILCVPYHIISLRKAKSSYRSSSTNHPPTHKNRQRQCISSLIIRAGDDVVEHQQGERIYPAKPTKEESTKEKQQIHFDLLSLSFIHTYIQQCSATRCLSSHKGLGVAANTCCCCCVYNSGKINDR